MASLRRERASVRHMFSHLVTMINGRINFFLLAAFAGRLWLHDAHSKRCANINNLRHYVRERGAARSSLLRFFLISAFVFSVLLLASAAADGIVSARTGVCRPLARSNTLFQRRHTRAHCSRAARRKRRSGRPESERTRGEGSRGFAESALRQTKTSALQFGFDFGRLRVPLQTLRSSE